MKVSGDTAPLRNGGDRKSGRIEVEAEFIFRQVEERRDITLAELQEKRAAHGTRVGIGTLCQRRSKTRPVWRRKNRPLG